MKYMAWVRTILGDGWEAIEEELPSYFRLQLVCKDHR
jgi:hypothetical protein